MTSATKKQLDFIEAIRELTGVPFVGHTKQETFAYIDANIEEFRQQRELKNALNAAVMDSLHSDWGDRD